MASWINVGLIPAGLIAGIGVYRLMTKSCWACDERLGRWTIVCTHCGRRQHSRPSGDRARSLSKEPEDRAANRPRA
jgi:hypothetical protein